jgi:hypothetical protein
MPTRASEQDNPSPHSTRNRRQTQHDEHCIRRQYSPSNIAHNLIDLVAFGRDGFWSVKFKIRFLFVLPLCQTRATRDLCSPYNFLYSVPQELKSAPKSEQLLCHQYVNKHTARRCRPNIPLW